MSFKFTKEEILKDIYRQFCDYNGKYFIYDDNPFEVAEDFAINGKPLKVIDKKPTSSFFIPINLDLEQFKGQIGTGMFETIYSTIRDCEYLEITDGEANDITYYNLLEYRNFPGLKEEVAREPIQIINYDKLNDIKKVEILVNRSFKQWFEIWEENLVCNLDNFDFSTKLQELIKKLLSEYHTLSSEIFINKEYLPQANYLKERGVIKDLTQEKSLIKILKPNKLFLDRILESLEENLNILSSNGIFRIYFNDDNGEININQKFLKKLNEGTRNGKSFFNRPFFEYVYENANCEKQATTVGEVSLAIELNTCTDLDSLINGLGFPSSFKQAFWIFTDKNRFYLEKEVNLKNLSPKLRREFLTDYEELKDRPTLVKQRDKILSFIQKLSTYKLEEHILSF